mmetsp:Transcript_15384/g.32553  ORF Transcript_15384/g.32553 Transcript_15384/m.32553 type:complete len:369 (+) Transcript_15384:67-1173(+)
MMSATVALPPAPDNLPPPPTGASAFEPPPLAVLPGDDLTRFILHNPPPTNRELSSPRKKKKKNKKSSSQDDNDDDDDANSKLPPKIGSGLACIQEPNNTKSVRIQATVAGRLLYRPSSRTWYIASNPRRYHLAQSPLASSSLASQTSRGLLATNSNVGVGDRILGIIADQKASADYYRVHIFGSHSALLHVLSFEGATKRNRPQLEPGCLIYCRVVKGFAGGRMDPEVSCKVGGGVGGSNSSGGGKNKNVKYNHDEINDDDGGSARKDWMTNEGTYGPLTGGTSFRISLGLARELLLPNNALLSALDKSGIPFEIAVGVNGMAWVNSPAPEITIMILNAVKNSEVMDEERVRGMVKVMVKNVKKELED